MTSVATREPGSLWRSMRDALARAMPVFSNGDNMLVERVGDHIRITYTSRMASPSGAEPTAIEIGINVDLKEMWIRSLNVSPPFRAKGLGRGLVRAAEVLAQSAEMESVNVLPLEPTREFWQKMGYAPHHSISRVMSKRVKGEGAGPALEQAQET